MMRRPLSRTFSSNPQPTPGGASALLVQFSYLQLLDILTTLAFLTSGVQEANPVVRLAMATARSPLWGLLFLKVCAVGGAVYCTRTARGRLLTRINFLFAVLIVWNLIALLGT